VACRCIYQLRASDSTNCFSMKVTVAAFIPDVPPEVTIQLERQDYIIGKVLDNIQDEDDDGLIDTSAVHVADFSVKFVDDDQL